MCNRVELPYSVGLMRLLAALGIAQADFYSISLTVETDNSVSLHVSYQSQSAMMHKPKLWSGYMVGSLRRNEEYIPVYKHNAFAYFSLSWLEVYKLKLELSKALVGYTVTAGTTVDFVPQSKQGYAALFLRPLDKESMFYALIAQIKEKEDGIASYK